MCVAGSVAVGGCLVTVCVPGRYLLCEVRAAERGSLLQLEERALSGAVRAAVARSHGDYGAALGSRLSGEQTSPRDQDVDPRSPKSSGHAANRDVF